MNEIIYIEFKNINDVNAFMNQMRHANEDVGNKVCDYIKSEAFERFQAVDHIAWELRKRNQKT